MTRSKIQSIPTTMVVGYWDEGSVSEVPENVKIVMSNGKRAMYRLVVNQPAPVLRDKIEKFTQICVGYEKPADAGTSDRRKKGLRG